MKTLREVLERGITPRVIGFDDAPFDKQRDTHTHVSGIVCAATAFEGMVYGAVACDGWDATDVLIELVRPSKFWDQIHLVLTDGVAFGGFNILDLPRLHAELERPVVSVMRRPPDFEAIFNALTHLEDTQARRAMIERAGQVHHHAPFYFQAHGVDPASVGPILEQLTLHGHVPEALRMAHLIGAAIETGTSGRRA